ncbi:2-C-methyl-D-erythritol 4-phosphate cytidylyltransferase [Bacillus sp. CGMCC 1.16607]|uniref:2-C-methyl-D-erythritol 4-phosphate cytidylyltransferase n=1 Tax=Bacillus sp. CGMCC 1.16607 TaxID=3351842 RepID=UPI00362635C9
MEYQVILPAAGKGKRMGAGKNKLFIELQGIPVFIHTLQVFEQDDRCREIYLSIHPDDQSEMTSYVKKFDIQKKITFVIGGKERQNSVYHALQKVDQNGIVLVHDAARPFINEALIGQLVESANQIGAAVVAVPVKDTIKKVKNGIVMETVERSSLWAVQTPQAFRVSLLLDAHVYANKNMFLGTDDASLVEYLGEKVAIIEGDYHNIKLTTPEDLHFAQAILNEKNQL